MNNKPKKEEGRVARSSLKILSSKKKRAHPRIQMTYPGKKDRRPISATTCLLKSHRSTRAPQRRSTSWLQRRNRSPQEEEMSLRTTRLTKTTSNASNSLRRSSRSALEETRVKSTLWIGVLSNSILRVTSCTRLLKPQRMMYRLQYRASHASITKTYFRCERSTFSFSQASTTGS